MNNQVVKNLIDRVASTIVEGRPELRGEVNALLTAFGVAPISTAKAEEAKPAVTRTRTGKITVSSSVIDSVEYAPGRLVVNFNSGASYCYYAVPRRVFNELLQAESAGAYFSENVRDCYSMKCLKGPFAS